MFCSASRRRRVVTVLYFLVNINTKHRRPRSPPEIFPQGANRYFWQARGRSQHDFFGVFNGQNERILRASGGHGPLVNAWWRPCFTTLLWPLRLHVHCTVSLKSHCFTTRVIQFCFTVVFNIFYVFDYVSVTWVTRSFASFSRCCHWPLSYVVNTLMTSPLTCITHSPMTS